jgi:Streptomyces sporulation and cell division protein, SsgA
MDKLAGIALRTVTEHIRLEFVSAEGQSSSLEAELVYEPSDPFAVTTVFKTGSQAVTWTFGRDLLVDGIYHPAGDGDVHVWPCLSSEGDAVVIIELCSPDGELLVQARSRDINRFVNAMLESVPQGRETEHVDLDAMLGDLLGA